MVGQNFMYTRVKQFAQQLFEYLQPECKAIYLGGSTVDNYIKDSHDIDLILFIDGTKKRLVESGVYRQRVKCRKKIKLFKHDNPDLNIIDSTRYKDSLTTGAIDLIQYRHIKVNTDAILNNKLTFWSYLDHFSIKLAGEDAELNDILKQQSSYIQVIKQTVQKLQHNYINQKRWYQVYIGLSILENNSYELTDTQKLNANILHDMKDETLDTRLKLQQEIIQKLEKM